MVFLGTSIRALRHRNFRLFFAGQLVALLGLYAQQTALSWFTYRVTQSASLLTSVIFVGQIPALIIMPLAGVAADRWNRRSALMLLQAAYFALLLFFAFVIWRGAARYRSLLVLNGVFGILYAIDVPLRQAFTIETVGYSTADLGNAITLDSLLVTLGRALAPIAAGYLVHWRGEAVCFALGAITCVCFFFLLLQMNIGPQPAPTRQGDFFREMREGAAYAFVSKPIAALLLLCLVSGVAGLPYGALLPVFVRDVFHADARLFGWLAGMPGIGAVVAAGYLASIVPLQFAKTRIAVAALTFGLALICFALTRNIGIAMIALLFTGAGTFIELANANIVVQTLVAEEKRGRVVSLFVLGAIGITPIGVLLAGKLAASFGAPLTVAAGGVVCVLATILYWHRMPRVTTTAT